MDCIYPSAIKIIIDENIEKRWHFHSSMADMIRPHNATVLTFLGATVRDTRGGHISIIDQIVIDEQYCSLELLGVDNIRNTLSTDWEHTDANSKRISMSFGPAYVMGETDEIGDFEEMDWVDTVGKEHIREALIAFSYLGSEIEELRPMWRVRVIKLTYDLDGVTFHFKSIDPDDIRGKLALKSPWKSISMSRLSAGNEMFFNRTFAR